MLSKVAFLLIAAASAVPTTPVAKAPTYTCTDDKNVTYKFWLEKDAVRMIAEKLGTQKTADLTLETPMGGGALDPDAERLYRHLNFKGATMEEILDLSTEFSMVYQKSNGGTSIRLTVVFENQYRFGLKCRASGYAVSVVGDETPVEHRAPMLLASYAGKRTSKGTLKPEGMIGVEASLLRFLGSSDATKVGRDRFASIAGPAIKNIDPRSVDTLTNKLTGETGVFWKWLLAEIKYGIYPYVNRYTSWVKEGARAKPMDYVSMAAGFSEFAASAGYRDKDILAFFVTETNPVLKQLTKEDVQQIDGDVAGQEATRFLLDTWAKALGKKTLADFAEIDRMAKELEGYTGAKEFEPIKFQKKFEAFLTSTMAANPEARTAFIQAVSPIVKRLTARQREDLMPWMEDDEQKKLLNELVE